MPVAQRAPLERRARRALPEQPATREELERARRPALAVPPERPLEPGAGAAAVAPAAAPRRSAVRVDARSARPRAASRSPVPRLAAAHRDPRAGAAALAASRGSMRDRCGGAAPRPGANASTGTGGMPRAAAPSATTRGAGGRRAAARRAAAACSLAGERGQRGWPSIDRGPRGDPRQAARERRGSAGQRRGAIVATQLGLVLERAAGEAIERLEQKRARDQSRHRAPEWIAPLEMRELVRERRFELLGLELVLRARGGRQISGRSQPRAIGTRAPSASDRRTGGGTRRVERDRASKRCASPCAARGGEETPAKARGAVGESRRATPRAPPATPWPPSATRRAGRARPAVPRPVIASLRRAPMRVAAAAPIDDADAACARVPGRRRADGAPTPASTRPSRCAVTSSVGPPLRRPARRRHRPAPRAATRALAARDRRARGRKPPAWSVAVTSAAEEREAPQSLASRREGASEQPGRAQEEGRVQGIGCEPQRQRVEHHRVSLLSCRSISALSSSISRASTSCSSQQMAHQRDRIPLEQPIGDLAHHGLGHLLLAHRRAVEVAPAVDAVPHHALGLHLLEHGGDRGRREPAVVEEVGMDLGRRGLAALPDAAQDRELEVSELVLLRHGLLGCNTA